MKNQEKNYDLLRNFDITTAKPRDIFQWKADDNQLEFIGATTINDIFCFKWISGEFEGLYTSYDKHRIKQIPLCWVEGKPAYKGDELWLSWFSRCGKVQAIEMEDGLLKIKHLEEDCQWYGYCNENISDLYWEKPKKIQKEAWANVYSSIGMISYYDTKEEADENAAEDRVACIKIQWEEECK